MMVVKASDSSQSAVSRFTGSCMKLQQLQSFSQTYYFEGATIIST
jgi:hypothetical protein